MLSSRRSSSTPQSPNLVPSPRHIEESALKGWGDLALEAEAEGKDDALPEAPGGHSADPSQRKNSQEGPYRMRTHSNFTLESVDGGRDVRIVSPVRARRDSVVQSESERSIHIAYRELRVVTHPETGQVFKTFFSTYVVYDRDAFNGGEEEEEKDSAPANAAPTRPTSYTTFVISDEKEAPAAPAASADPKLVTRYTQYFNE